MWVSGTDATMKLPSDILRAESIENAHHGVRYVTNMAAIIPRTGKRLELDLTVSLDQKEINLNNYNNAKPQTHHEEKIYSSLHRM